MAVCNIFGHLKYNTGNFLTFSQYVEDLTRESTQSVYYRVTPSKFVALDVDYSNFNDYKLVKDLQDVFENGCAVCRGQITDKWTPDMSTNLFWKSLFDMKLISSDENNYINEIKYVGDINIQSYNEYNGVGYSEIYCYIPNEAKEFKYQYSSNTSNQITYYSNSTIEGYSAEEFDGAIIAEKLSYMPYIKTNFSWFDDALNTIKLDSNKFQINTIVVLYDILTKTENGSNQLYKNVPLGIYFPGSIEDGKMTNSITKYISNEDIFGAGTSYGLRICSRFSVSPGQNNIKVVDVTVDNDNYSIISQVMSQMAKSQEKMDEILTKVQSNNLAEKELLSIFKNSKTNVPYIKNINGVSYWFVNGRNIGSVLGDVDCECVPYDNQDIIDMLNKSLSLLLRMSACNANGVKVFDYSTDEAQDIIIKWEVLFNNEVVRPDEIYLNGDSIDANLNTMMKNNIYNTTTYSMSVKKEGLVADASDTVYFVWPTFFGTLPCDETCGDGVIHTFKPTEIAVKSLDKYVNISKSNTYTYTNMTRPNGNTDHLILAYPCEFGPLSSILDEYKYEYLDDFIRHDMEFNFNGKKIPYYVYVDKTPAEVENFSLKFS